MKINKKWEAILDLLLLVGLFWIVRYWHSPHFGLYEDDLTIIPDAFARSFSSLMGFIFNYISHFLGQGRPLHHSLIYLFSWVGWQTIGLWGPYLVGYLITAINIGLFYWLMRRVTNRPMALLAGFGYILYSADTTQAYLTLSLGVQPSMTLILLALHGYFSNKRILAYILAFIVLFSYETPFLLFLVAPLLKKTWNKALLKEMLWHTVIIISMLGLIYLFRHSIGGDGVVSLGLRDIITTPFLHMLEGPIVSLGTFVFRPYQVIKELAPEIGLAVVASFVAFFWIISRLPVSTRVNIRLLWSAIKDPLARSALPEDVKSIGRLFLIGIIMLVAAYPLTFTVRAYAISGRDTRVHFAGVAGAAILVAVVTFFLIYLTNGSNWRKFVNILISLELALMVGYGFVIQRDYVLAWQYQREFWTELVPLIQDVQPNTYVLVTSDSLKDTQAIDANTWNLPIVLGQLYEFPSQTVPRVFRLRPGWQDHLDVSAAIFLSSITSYAAPDFYEKADFPYIILIDTSSGRMVRCTAPLAVDGTPYSIKKPSDPTLPLLPHGVLYDLLIIQP